jgi:hypothetical protein
LARNIADDTFEDVLSDRLRAIQKRIEIRLGNTPILPPTMPSIARSLLQTCAEI